MRKMMNYDKNYVKQWQHDENCREKISNLMKIKGPDNPTSQRLPIMSNKSWSGTGKEGKTKEVVEDREVKKVVCEELCVWKIAYSHAQLNDASASTGDQSH